MATTALINDLVGGIAPVISTGQSFVTVDKRLVVLNTPKDLVTPHLLGIHAAPTNHMVGSIQGFVFINKFNVMINGDLALCGDPVLATGFVNIT